MATPVGPFKLALVARPPSPENPCVPSPATVLMVPEVSTLRMRLSLESAMKRLPEESTATPKGKFNLALVAGPPSPANPFPPPPGHGADVPRGVHLADAVVDLINYEEVAGGVHGDVNRSIQLGARSRAAIARESCRPIARHGADVPRGVYLANAVVRQISDEEVAGGVHRHAKGEIQLGAGGRAPVARESFPSTARPRC